MWYANDPTVSAGNPRYFADGSFFSPPPPSVPYGSRTLEVADNLNGSVKLAWPPLTNPVDSYNVYANGVLKQQTFVNGLGSGYTCTVTGLQIASYANGVLTPALTYTFSVYAVFRGQEIINTFDAVVTPGPSSVMLTTPMRRPFPFPNFYP